MLELLIAIVVVFALFAIAFRRSLMYWMKSGYKTDQSAADLMAADALMPEEKQKLRERYKQQMKSGS